MINKSSLGNYYELYSFIYNTIEKLYNSQGYEFNDKITTDILETLIYYHGRPSHPSLLRFEMHKNFKYNGIIRTQLKEHGYMLSEYRYTFAPDMSIQERLKFIKNIKGTTYVSC